MVRNLSVKGYDIGAAERVRDTDLIEATVNNAGWTAIYEKQSTKSLKYAAGNGVSNRQGNAGFADMDLQDDVAGAIDGQLRWEVYRDANKDDLIGYSPIFRTEDLRAAVSSERTEKPMMPLYEPGAPEDGYLVLACKSDSDTPQTVDQTNSSVGIGLPITRFQT